MEDGLVSPFIAGREELIARTRQIAREVLAPLVDAGEPARVNRPLVRALGEHGVLAQLFGGAYTPSATVSALELCLLRESLALESTEAETAFALQGLGAFPLLQSGGSELVARWLPAVARGEAVVAFALTEPDAGSDAAALQLSAERVSGGYRLSGVKTFISNAPDADLYSLFARTSPGSKAAGITALAVAGDAPGLGGTPLELMAPHPIGRLELDDVFVPDDHVLGTEGDGFRVAMRTLDLFRPSVGAFAVGIAQRGLDAAVAHAGTRHAFGRPLREFQAVSHQLAEMATQTHAARLLVHAAAVAYDQGDARITRQSAMAKLFATETAQRVVDIAIQVHGAVALERGHLLEHLYRDVRALRIYEGASELQREIIARDLYR